MPTLDQQYEARHLRNISTFNRRIRAIYEDSIYQLTLIAATLPYNGQIIALTDYPILKNRIDRLIQEMHADIYSTVVNGIQTGWSLANEKNDILVDRRLAGKRPTETAKTVLYDPNAEGLKQFIERKERGLNLSQRVYNTLDLFGPEVERGLLLGIANGESAATMATEMKSFLKFPDKLFRRVRDAEGKLRLSRPARDFHPGQGVYRSSYKNALRLTATETNIAYRRSDNARWNQLPFVVGIDIHTSGNHPKYDLCDELKGAYPKDFVFTGWHPQCICYQTSRLMTDDEYSKHEDEILGIGKLEGTPANEITEPPQGFKDFLEANKEKINGWSNTPYWVKDNPGYTASLNE